MANPAQEAALSAYRAGLTDPAMLALAVAIAGGESQWNPGAVGDTSLQDSTWGPSFGLWQIRSLWQEQGKGTTRDPIELAKADRDFNARSMFQISGGGTNWQPWSVYTNGSYRSYLNEATAAAQYALEAQRGPLTLQRASTAVSRRLLALEQAKSKLGVTEYPPGSNYVEFWDYWGDRDGIVRGNEVLGAWCAAFVSWAYESAGAPLPQLQGGRPGFVGVPIGVAYAVRAGQTTTDPQPGDIVFYSWEPVLWDNGWPWTWWQGAWVTAGDHVGIVDHMGPDGSIWSVEGNTSVSGSQDNGGAVLLRNRPASQAICFWRPPAGDYTQQVGPGAAPAETALLLEENNMIHWAVERPERFDWNGVSWVVKDIPYAPIDGSALPGGKVAQHSALVMTPVDPGTATGGGHIVVVFRNGEKIVDGNIVSTFEDPEFVTLATYGAWRTNNVAGRYSVLHRPEQPTHVFVRELSYLV